MAKKHYIEQRLHAETYLLPYFQTHIPVSINTLSVLEIGCAEGGFLDTLYLQDIKVEGIEIEARRVKIALENNPELTIYIGDITDPALPESIGRTFDLIVLRDVIEHITDRERVFKNIRKLLNRGGYLYITFPPRFSPYAGHQQNCTSCLKLVPFLQLFPEWLMRFLGRLFREQKRLIQQVIINYRIGLSICSFERLCHQFKFKPVVYQLFLVRPIFKIRFGLKTRLFPNMSVVREFFVLGCESLLRKN